MTSDPLKQVMLSQSKFWDGSSNDIWLASSLNLSRNIEKFHFPPKLDSERKKQMVTLVGKNLESSRFLKNPKLLTGDKLAPLHKEFLLEHFLSTHSFQQAHAGEAFVLDQTGSFLGLINIQDHLCFQTLDTSGELENTWQKLVDLEMSLGKAVSYAFSSKYGFLTANPFECGTALAVSLFLQMPGLVHLEKIDDTLEELVDDSFLVTGIQGNPTEIIGDVIVIRNNYMLGVTEESIIASMRSLATKLILEENRARASIRAGVSADIKDRVSRSFGILIHSYKIEAIEALNALSLLKLGASLGWVEGISINEINNLFFNCRRAHLLIQHLENLSQEEVLHRRAEYIHGVLRDVKLTV